ncbi:MAG: conjugal transfer protein TraX [Clostridiaceae bacterium]|nr:conjugal transfer protein TraX [Clostridiaceae bacterium]
MNETTNAAFALSRTQIQLLAAVTMLCDHIACVLIDRDRYGVLYQGMRIAGRISFVLFAFLLVQGFLHTRSLSRYLGRIFLFACLSEIAFDLAFSGKWFDPGAQNVLFTFFVGIFVLSAIQRWEKNLPATAAILFAGCAACSAAKTDYSAFGIIILVFFYLFRFERKKQLIMILCILLFTSGIEVFACLALPFCLCYCEEKKGIRLPRYFFYVFYPAHLLALCLIRQLI